MEGVVDMINYRFMLNGREKGKLSVELPIFKIGGIVTVKGFDMIIKKIIHTSPSKKTVHNQNIDLILEKIGE